MDRALDSFKSFLGYFLGLSICKIMYPTNYGVLIYFYNFETNEIGNPKVHITSTDEKTRLRAS